MNAGAIDHRGGETSRRQSWSSNGSSDDHRSRDSVPEPRLQPVPTGTEKKINDAIERAASAVTTVVAALLMVFVVIAIIGVVVVAWDPLVHQHDFMRAAVAGLDAAFIAIILLELVHTTLSRGPITSQIQEFLVIGITSAIRSGLESAAGHDNPRETSIVLVITSFASLLLVSALWLLRQRLHAERKPVPAMETTKSPKDQSQ